MDSKKLVPYSVYLPVEHYKKLKEAAKTRKASELIRDAIGMIVDGHDLFNSGYNKGVADAAKVIYECEEAQMIAIKGKDLGSVLAEKIDALEIKK
jgi:ribulose-5-phosphate 4-epimerase/fuculose-1-phosphate aldolase